MLDIDLTLLFSIPMFIFGWFYFKRRLSTGTTLRSTTLATIGISFYMALVFFSMVGLTAHILSSQIPGYEKLIYKDISFAQMLLDYISAVLLTFAGFSIASILGGLLYYQKSGRRQPSTKQQA